MCPDIPPSPSPGPADPDTQDLESLTQALARALKERGWTIATAESCTGGAFASAMTDLAGSSEWFGFGWITYANQAKIRELGVPDALLQAHGAVSAPVARAMAEGALAQSGADLAVALTGIAGPGGGSPEKPVGLVYLGLATRGQGVVVRALFQDVDRKTFKRRAVGLAFRLALHGLDPGNTPLQGVEGVRDLLPFPER